MIDFIVNMISGVVGFLTGSLPRSPFSDMSLAQDVTQWLGWLNWLVPMQSMLATFSIVLTAFVAAKAAVALINTGLKAGSIVVKDK